MSTDSGQKVSNMLCQQTVDKSIHILFSEGSCTTAHKLQTVNNTIQTLLLVRPYTTAYKLHTLDNIYSDAPFGRVLHNVSI